MIDKNYISPLEEGGGKRTNMIYKDPLQKKGGFWFFSVCVIRKKGYGVYFHNKKSLHALDKTQSKGTAPLLLFFISRSQ